MSSYLVILANLIVSLLIGPGLSLAAVVEPQASNALKEQIMAGTIQIEVYDDIGSDGGVIHSYKEQGLGTLVEYDGQLFIMTHNHWQIAHTNLEWVELYDGYGRLLVALDGSTFTSLARFHDEGTLLIVAPDDLSAAAPVSLADSSDLNVGDSVWITTRDKQHGRSLRVSRVKVKQAGGLELPGKLRLSGPRTAVAPGDSGGGVWQDGRLVGNMWAVVEELGNSPWGRSGGSGTAQPTGDTIAARLPRVGDIGFTETDKWIYDAVELP